MRSESTRRRPAHVVACVLVPSRPSMRRLAAPLDWLTCSFGTCALPEAAAGAVETAAVETWVCAHEPGLSRDLLALGSQLEVS